MKRTIYYMILCLLMSLGEIMAQGISGKVMDGKEQPVDGVAVILQTLDSVYVWIPWLPIRLGIFD